MPNFTKLRSKKSVLRAVLFWGSPLILVGALLLLIAVIQ
jgi:hypothetical protein